MKKYLLISFAFFIIIGACQHPNKKGNGIAIKTNIYDSSENKNLKLLDSLGLIRYNDSAKWRLYTIHCDDSALQEDNRYIPVSSLNLKLGLVSKENDTLDLLYSFMENDSTTINRELKEKYITAGIQFKTSEDKVIAYIHGEGTFTIKGSTSRFQNPMQPEVITYIKKNQDKLNPWFRNEAKRRGILQ
jgi:hypothetical protein